MSRKTIQQAQRAWAERRSLDIDGNGYCRALDDNLFRPLSPSTREELLSGDGGELGTEGQPGKAQALHSSSMLACNFFDYWRSRDLSILSRLFGTGELAGLQFEAKFPTGLRGNAPNLDVVLDEAGGGVVAIESKFTEPYSGSNKNGVLRDAYFEQTGTWSAKGLPGCQRLAEELRGNPTRFRVLDAAQLLKHMLGLANCGRPWRLHCLWYRAEGEIGDLHAAELEQFASAIGPDAPRFTAETYQDVFGRMKNLCPAGHEAYLDYLEGRYFPPA